MQGECRKYLMLTGEQSLSLAEEIAAHPNPGRVLINNRCLLSGVKRKYAEGTGMSAFDPLRHRA
jgi:hypothetical protein